MKKIVGISKESLSINHLRHFHDSIFERFDGLTITLTQGDKNDGGKIQT